MKIGPDNLIIVNKKKKIIAVKSTLKTSKSTSRIQASKPLSRFSVPTKKKKKANKTRMQDFINAYGCTTI